MRLNRKIGKAAGSGKLRSADTMQRCQCDVSWQQCARRRWAILRPKWHLLVDGWMVDEKPIKDHIRLVHNIAQWQSRKNPPRLMNSLKCGVHSASMRDFRSWWYDKSPLHRAVTEQQSGLSWCTSRIWVGRGRYSALWAALHQRLQCVYVRSWATRDLLWAYSRLRRLMRKHLSPTARFTEEWAGRQHLAHGRIGK